MAVNPMLTAGSNGITQGIKAVDSVATEIAQLNGQVGTSVDDAASTAGDSYIQDTAEAIVDLQLYERQVQASAKVVKSADEMLGFLLDVHA